MLARLRSKLRPPSFPGDDERARRAYLLHQLLLVFVVLALVMGAASAVAFVRPLQSMLFVGAALAALATCYGVMLRGRLQLASTLFVTSFWVITTGFLSLAGATATAAATFYLAVPLLAGMLLGRRAAVLSGVASSLAALTVVLLERSSWALPRVFPVPALAGWVDLTVVLALVTFVLFLTLRSLEEALASARRDLADRLKAEQNAARLEGQLVQAQKMEAIGRLAGGVAHDFNNLLTAIVGNLDLAALQATSPEQRRLLDEAQRATDSAAALAQQLLAFSRHQPLEERIIELGELVAGSTQMLGRLVGDDVTLELVGSTRPALVRANVSQLEQILVNLVVNARDAMPAGGQVQLEISETAVDEEWAMRVGRPAGRYALLVVSDSGDGMEPEVVDRIFEPFFTTKALGRGTGLGLATVYGAVAQCGGFLEVSSTVGVGSAFRLYFPAAEADETAAIATAVVARVAGGTETILLVEDEDAVRRLAQRVLEDEGYQVLACPNGAAALERMSAHEGPLELLFTDVVMPGLGGRALAEQVRRVRPQLRVLFTSGYADDMVVRHGVQQATLPFLAKPYRPEQLARKVREVLDGPPPNR